MLRFHCVPPRLSTGIGGKVALAVTRREERCRVAEAFSSLEEFAAEVLALIAEQPDLTLVQAVAELRKRRIKTSRSSLWRLYVVWCRVKGLNLRLLHTM